MRKSKKNACIHEYESSAHDGITSHFTMSHQKVYIVINFENLHFRKLDGVARLITDTTTLQNKPQCVDYRE